MKPERQEKIDYQLQIKNNCCQVVLNAFCADFGISPETLLPLAGGLGGGMSLGEKCGVVTAMIMIAGLSYGPFDGADAQKKNALKEIVRTLNARFEEAFGSSQCRTLMGNIGQKKYDLTQVQQQGKRPCAIFMEKACDILEEELGI
ncbi:MAG: C-GCAxxG-C-C family protein [Oscillospiraceae bacterium]|nr:C-GCAxxG-C-C family protein [Oscillospiraceae bacterium]